MSLQVSTFKTNFPEMLTRDELHFFHIENLRASRKSYPENEQGRQPEKFEQIFAEMCNSNNEHVKV